MVPIKRSQPAPECLDAEADKRSGDYNCGDVLERLVEDGFGKCYICETANLTAIQIEHIQPHQQDKMLKFDWNNLLLSCGHCNNTKSNRYYPILDCTNAADEVDKAISYRVRSFPKSEVVVEANRVGEKVANTVNLLVDVYTGTTKIKRLEAHNLRKLLVRELADFRQAVAEDKMSALREHLRSSSPFCAFKRWIVWDNPVLEAKYARLIENV